MQEHKITKDNSYQTSLRMTKELYKEIEKLANENERKISEQIRFMLTKYIEITKNK